MLARDTELETLEEKCRGLTQQLKAALDTHVMEKLQMEKLQVECDALKQTIEDGDKKQHADDRTKRITESCDEYVRLIIGETDCAGEEKPEMVELFHVSPRVDADSLETVGLHGGSQVETHDKDGQRIRRESSDEGIGLSCGDTDDVIEGRGIVDVERRRRFERGRHQPVRLPGWPSRLLGTRDPAAGVVARLRCLPCVPAREENDVDMSAEAVSGLLVRALDRSRGEHSSETSCMQSRRDAEWRPDPLGLPRSVWTR